ncbi:nitrogen permease regulator of amino acid transport activity 3-domain-containing protein [Terfezia claveryi]|nr:nitrogen permease regulator of amino acid transport activity 3-domain-containing protein [Terfezia claveryi]
MERSSIPNASLVAVLLVTQSSAGPNLVFHYPPNPKIDNPAESSMWGVDNSDDERSSNSSVSTNSTDDELDNHGASDAETGVRKMLDQLELETVRSESDRRSRSYAGGRHSSRRMREDHEDDHEDDDEEDNDGAKPEATGPPWENVFGFKTSFLASLLAPKASMCRTKFEMTIDDLVFLGYPVNIRSDGTWKKQRKRRKNRGIHGQFGGSGQEGEASERLNDEQEGADEHKRTEDDEAAGHEADDEDEPGEDQKSGGAEEDKDEWGDGIGMSMFHVVFVMNPPQLEYHTRVHEMYTCVVKKFARALKLEQARTDYVRKEMELILKMKDKAIHDDMSFHDLWQHTLASSNLASAIASVYTAISASKLAHVYINDSIDLSLQLPMISETSVLPSLYEPHIPGLFLTTANTFDQDDTEGDSMTRNFTLLFLDEKENIEREIEKEIDKEIMAEPTNANSNLLYFVQHCKPTLSFAQIASQAGLPIAEVQVLARHLIYWRRARAIPPINLRDYYIVSPNADMRKLSAQIPIYSRKFPTLPSLPKMLSSLSSRPRPFSSLIPSRDHRRAYLDILAWLLCHGWVTQLRTFGLLKIPKEIKLKVAKEQAMLEQQKQQKQAAEDYEDSFILEPQQASSEESAWMEMITRDQPTDVTAVFDRMTRYLNGHNALEKIPFKEGISRKECKRVVTAMEKYICLVSELPFTLRSYFLCYSRTCSFA